MSIKTPKRLVLAVIAALVFAPFAAIAPASADPTWIQVGKLTKDDGTALASSKYTAQTVLTADGISSFTVTAGSAVVLNLIGQATFGATSDVRVTMRGIGVILDDTTGVTAATTSDVSSFTATSVPGTYILDIALDLDDSFSTTGDQVTTSVTMVVVAGPTLSGSLSTAYMAAFEASTYNATTNAIARSADDALGTAIASVKITLLNSLGAADTSSNRITASINGVGYVGLDATTTDTNPSTRIVEEDVTRSVTYAHIFSDGTTGTGTLTIKVRDNATLGTTTLGTFNFTSTGNAASVAVSTTRYTIGRAGYTTGGAESALSSTNWVTATAASPITPISSSVSTPAFVVVVKDSAGNPVTGANAGSSTPAVTSSNSAVSSGGSCALDNGADSTYSSSKNGIGYYNCKFTIVSTATSGSTATLTVAIDKPGSTTAEKLTTTYTVTVGGVPATEKVEFNKATYGQGEAITVTRSAVDASGNSVYDGAIAPALTFNKQIGGTAPAAAFYVGGKTSSNNALGAATLFAPVTFGTFSGTATGKVSAASATITATASVPAPAAPVVEVVQDKPTLTVAKNGGRIILSGTAVDGEGDIIVYVKKVGKTAWKERAKTLEVAAPGDFNGSIKAPKSNVLIRVKQEGTGLFSNQIIVVK